MNISAQSLYHYTPKFDNMIGIIQKGFKYNIIVEELPLTTYTQSFFSKFDKYGVIKYQQQIPIVCFCDISFNLIDEHRNQYGKYCIGLSKEWAIDNGITPVRYIHYGSPDIHNDVYRLFTQSLSHLEEYNYDIFKFFHAFLQETTQINELPAEGLDKLPEKTKKILKLVNQLFFDISQHTVYSMGFLKAYKGRWVDRVTGEENERNFYDEKEWRALQKDNKDYLSFKINDINYVIVETPEEKKILLNKIIESYNISKGEEKNNISEKIKIFNELLPGMKEKL